MPVLGTLSPVGNARRLLGDAAPAAAVAGEARLSWRRWRRRWWETEPGFAAAFQTGLFLINLNGWRRRRRNSPPAAPPTALVQLRELQVSYAASERGGNGSVAAIPLPRDGHPGASPVFLGRDSGRGRLGCGAMAASHPSPGEAGRCRDPSPCPFPFSRWPGAPGDVVAESSAAVPEAEWVGSVSPVQNHSRDTPPTPLHQSLRHPPVSRAC